MAKAKIGIRYCGGCNPRYERVEMVRQIESLPGDRFLFVRHDQKNLDGLIAVNGCPRACVVKELAHQSSPYHSITGEGDLNGLIEWLAALSKK